MTEKRWIMIRPSQKIGRIHATFALLETMTGLLARISVEEGYGVHRVLLRRRKGPS